MPIVEKDLGLQPKVTRGDDGVYNAELVPSKEWVATGKEIKDPEFAKLMDGASEQAEEDRARRESMFGLDRITDPYGNVETIRLDEIEEKKKHGYGIRKRTERMVVPELPWQDKMKKMHGRTLIRYRDGRRLVIWENGVKIKHAGEE